MITPALDLQAAPQMVDGVRSQAAQPDGSGDGGDFGATFTATLSSSSPTAAYTSDSETVATQGSPQQNSVSVRNTSDRSVPAQKSTVLSSATATSVKLPVRATSLTLLNAGAKDSSGSALSEEVASAASKPTATLAESSDGKAPNVTAGKVSVPVALAADPSLSSQTKDGLAAAKANSVAASDLAELQASLVSASRPLSAEVSDTSKTPTPVKGSEVAGKSKATTHDSQPAEGAVKSDLLLASLGTSAPVLTAPLIVNPLPSTKETSAEVETGSKVQLASAGQNLRVSTTALSVTGAAASKSNLATAWNSIEIAAPSGRDTGTTEAASGVAHTEFVHAVGLAGSSLGTAAAPGTGGGLASVDRLPSPPVHWPTSPVPTDVAQSSEAAASSASPGLAVVKNVNLHTSALGASLSPASSPDTTAQATSTATDALGSGLVAKPQTAIVEPVASHSLNSAGQVKSTTAGVLASSPHAVDGSAQSASTRAVGTAATPTSSVQSDAKAAPIANQPKELATPAVAIPIAPTTIKQPAVQPERVSASHTTVAAAGTQAVSSSHRGSLDDSAAPPDRGAGSDASSVVVTIHADSFAATAPSHTASSPTLDLSNTSIAATANLAATVAHQGPAGATGSSTTTALGAVGSAAVQAAGSEALHGASSLSFQPHQTLAATPTSLEVGVHSGTQGWLKIRAEVGDQGDVTASLAATSTSGQQSLKGQLPALNAYLQSEQMSVTTSVAERIGATHPAVAHEALLGSSSAGTGSAGQDTSLLQSGAGQSAFSQGGGHQGSGVNSSPTSGDAGREGALQTYASRVESSGSAPTSAAVDGSGRWLNVRV